MSCGLIKESYFRPWQQASFAKANLERLLKLFSGMANKKYGWFVLVVVGPERGREKEREGRLILIQTFRSRVSNGAGEREGEEGTERASERGKREKAAVSSLGKR